MTDLAEYLDIQGSTEFLTRTELRQTLRDLGLSLTDRNLTYYTSMKLIPPAIRVGGRAAAYPAIVAEQLAWVIRARARGQSIESIRELAPLWRWLMRNRHDSHIDLREFELVAHRHELSREANFAVPYLVSEVLMCLCGACMNEIEWILKDGTPLHHSDETPLALTFVIGAVNEETGVAEPLAWTQLAFPEMGYPDTASPTCITLGAPIGGTLTPPDRSRTRSTCERRSQSSDRHAQREALPLG